MRADNSQFIVDAAKRRRAGALSRARTVLAEALRVGEPTTVSQLAAAANVSRSWLYAEASLHDELGKITAATAGNPRPMKPSRASRPASDASLRTRLDVAIDRARRLEVENRQLRDQLARALGQLRNDGVTGRRPDSVAARP